MKEYNSNIVTIVTNNIYDKLKDISDNIYTDKTTQGVEEPCFIVNVVDDYLKRQLSSLRKIDYTRDTTIEVVFLNSNENLINIHQVEERMLFALERLDYKGDTIHAKDVSSQILDGNIHLLVNYKLRLTEYPDKAPGMLEININHY